MRFRCKTAELRNKVGIISDVVPKQDIQPLLGNMKVSVGEQVELSATGPEVGITTKINDAESLEAGSILVPGRFLNDLLHYAVEEEVEVIQEDLHLIVKLGTAQYKVYGREAEQFPDLPAFNADEAITIPAADMSFMIDVTEFAVSREPTRYDTHGVLLSISASGEGRRSSKATVEMVATDAKRMAQVTKKLPVKLDGSREVIVPVKAFRELRKLLPTEGEGTAVGINISDRQIVFQSSVATLSAQLLTGRYPDYKAAIPKDPRRKLTTKASTFLGLLYRAQVAASPSLPKVECTLGDGKVVLSAQSEERGEARVEQSVAYEGEPLTILLRPELLTDVLRRIGDEEITIEFTDASTPCILRWGRDYLYLAMPMSPAA